MYTQKPLLISMCGILPGRRWRPLAQQLCARQTQSDSQRDLGAAVSVDCLVLSRVGMEEWNPIVVPIYSPIIVSIIHSPIPY